MSAIYESYNETCNKATTLLQSFGNLVGNSYGPFLLLILCSVSLKHEIGKIIKSPKLL